MSGWLKINRVGAETWVCLNLLSPTDIGNQHNQWGIVLTHMGRREPWLCSGCGHPQSLLLLLSLPVLTLKLRLWTEGRELDWVAAIPTKTSTVPPSPSVFPCVDIEAAPLNSAVAVSHYIQRLGAQSREGPVYDSNQFRPRLQRPAFNNVCRWVPTWEGMQTRSLRKFHDPLFAAKVPLLKECVLTFPPAPWSPTHTYTQLPFGVSRQTSRAKQSWEKKDGHGG